MSWRRSRRSIDIFALPGLAPVPPSTPTKNLASQGTIGDGPYMWSSISPEHQYVLVKNPKFDVPGLARGYADKIIYNVNSNVLANAQAVLNNQADVFDPGDTLPSSVLQQIQSQAADRYQPIPLNSSWYFWFATYKKPFNNLDARKAVLAAMDDRALSRLDSGFQTPDCHLIPFGIIGHSSPSSCTALIGHNPDGPPNMTLAKQLMQKSGMIGQPVIVYGEERSPRRQYLDYFTSVLNSLGFKATEKVVNSSVYFTTIGAPTLKPTVGFGDWNQDFPNPWDFMQLFAGNAGSSLNYGYVNDPHYNSELNTLDQQPPETVASQWAGARQVCGEQGVLRRIRPRAEAEVLLEPVVLQHGRDVGRVSDRPDEPGVEEVETWRLAGRAHGAPPGRRSFPPAISSHERDVARPPSGPSPWRSG